FVLEEVRWPPLIRRYKIQPPVAVNVGNGNASTDHGFRKAKQRPDVVIPSVGTAHEERITVTPAQIRSGSEAGPEARIVDDLVVARAERLQFGPPIYFSLDEPAGLDCFQHAVVIEIRQTSFEGESTAGQPEFFAALNVRSGALFHAGHVARA